MAKKLEGTQTLGNLMKAFAGESQARMRYTYYASRARKDGYNQIEEIFLETADNERAHAKRFFDAILDGIDEQPKMVNVNADYPVALGDTLFNLKEAAAGEHEEHTILYPGFAKIAKEEGFAGISSIFMNIARVEVEHEERYLAFVDNIIKDRVFKRETAVKWKCRNCGYVHDDLVTPDLCPACAHPKNHFEIKAYNW
ncbi:rubrerythrin family protein [Desulfurispirillum indicum]|uniref:Rubrerythrin n=1 Tax=Desulfurispirillum indicum (strain ATCC BAA-1389 / DSM 22839 / S5) TaxID=653733 RepID=E6W3V9_DESIS|nr:rubrerythrin family protein [Desulfurispirillum indicum]ADU65827.1 Rubrerythrin [Desulfurispirillum indicum S5]UCZ57762.1 rubrerythrin family protein [Desulfurispirillum indicum]